MKKGTIFFSIYLVLILTIGFGHVQGEQSASDTIKVELKVPTGNVVYSKTFTEGDSLEIKNRDFPFDILNGTVLNFPDSAVSEDIKITMEVPDFASIDVLNSDISFGDSIATAVDFTVTVGDSTVSPFEFHNPLTLTLPIPKDIPEDIKNKIDEFVLAYRDSTGAFDTTGVKTIEVDSANGIVTGKIAHLSTVAMTTEDQTTTDISSPAVSTPEQYKLYQNYPNPFNPVTTIAYDLKQSGHVTLSIYNILGRKVATLVDREQNSGHHEVRFDASELSSGVYIYRIQAGSFTSLQQMTVIK